MQLSIRHNRPNSAGAVGIASRMPPSKPKRGMSMDANAKNQQ